jgi:para-aminobenzoate synthetase/4-amino-4-deoxychorismate lyase
VPPDLPFCPVRRPLDWDLDPVEALTLVRRDAHPIALIGSWADGTSVISSEPLVTSGPPLPLTEVFDAPTPASRTLVPDGVPGPGWTRGCSPAFGGGWMGYLGFGLACDLMPVPPAPGEPPMLPTWWFGYYDHVLLREGASGRWFFEALWTAERAGALERRFSDLSQRARAARIRPVSYSCGPFQLFPPAGEHESAVAQAVEYIRAGDIFQANICLRLEADYQGDPLDSFCRAAPRLRPPFAAFMRIPGGDIASLSPELFLRRSGRNVLSQPIKGTCQRSSQPGQAARQRRQLSRSAKNRSENIMIVDLLRNDLSRVCRPGSVDASGLARAEAHPGLWHLVSDVRGTLGEGNGDGDLIRATFPPGSVTGAPKVRAVEIIRELEPAPREVYTGAIGYRSPVAGLEFSVAIRTFEFHRGRVWLGSGGGIVAGSVPADEYHECLIKAGPLISALGARLGGDQEAPASRGGPGMTPRILRPRPAAGVFTSLRVTAGATRHLPDHLARLSRSSQILFGKDLPETALNELAARLGELPSGRLRICVKPMGGPLRITVQIVAAGPAPPPLDLVPVTITGGLGGHKWEDRRLIGEGRRSRRLQDDQQLLIEDAGGEVLETDRANVFAVIGGVLRTPPCDGRLLPGVTRAAVLRMAEAAGITAEERPVDRAALFAASEVFVTNALHGIIPVRSIAGRTVDSGWGPVRTRLSELLTTGSRTGIADVDTHLLSSAPGMVPRKSRPAGPLVVLLDNYDSFTYNVAHMLATCGAQVEVVRNDEVSAQQIAGLRPAGVVISPGPCAPADAGISVELAQACAGQFPLLGVCLGHQAIAAAFGARIVRAPGPVHGQTSPMVHDGSGVLRGLPPRFDAARYHSLVVDRESLPAILSATAVTDAGRGKNSLVMALRHRTQPIHGIQFHPESVLTLCGGMIISNFLAEINSFAHAAS